MPSRGSPAFINKVMQMTRSTAREIAVRLVFGQSENPRDPGQYLEEVLEPAYFETLRDEDAAFSEYPDDAQLAYIKRVVKGVGEHSAELDSYIERYAVGWKFGRISRTAVAILKTSMFEVLYMPDIPNRAAINEAVELSKRYEAPETVPFINGLLGSFVRSETT